MMVLKSVDLKNFRNFRAKNFRFSKGLTLIVADNAKGKTNLLEAIWLLVIGKSFKAKRDKEMIRYKGEVAWVEGLVDDDRLEVMVTGGEVAGKRVAKKSFKINGLNKRRSDFVGILRGVSFRPEDLGLLLGGPTRRREYVNSVLEQVDREYRRSLLTYKKGLRQRNKLLEKIRAEYRTALGKAQVKQLYFWNQMLVKNGQIITDRRQELVEFFNEAFGREKISQVLNGLELKYDRSLISEKRLEQYKNKEVMTGVTLVGPHRDDFILESGGKELPKFGSRGEQRLGVLALKLAEISFITSIFGKRPLLLLDDIFSELDHEHRDDVLEVIGQQQTIMTTTDLHLVEKRFRNKMKVIEI